MIALLCAAAVVAVAAGVLLSGGSRPARVTLGAVVEAADRTTQAGGAAVSIGGTVSSASLSMPLTLSGTGHTNFAAAEGQMTFTMTGFPAAMQTQLPGGSLTMNELYKSGSLYMESPLFDGKLPNGARWVKIDLARVGEAMGLDPSSITSGGASPAQYLSYLKDGAVTNAVVAHETLRGVATTRYSGDLDLLKVAEAQPGTNVAQARAAFQKISAETGQSSMPIEVWVDRQDRVRRMALTLATATGGQHAQSTIDVEYFNFGTVPAVNVPAEDEVFDVTSQALKGLAG